jgi:hypothetical protein
MMGSDTFYLRDRKVFVEARHAGKIAHIFSGADLTTELDREGNITDIYFDVNLICVDEELFKELIPFMRTGSFFEFCDEMGHLWRWVFHDGDCCAIDAIVLWPKPGEMPDLSKHIHKALEYRLMAE